MLLYNDLRVSLSEILSLSQCPEYQDVTIICGNGSLNVSSFILASIFPFMKDLISDEIGTKICFSMPDLRLIQLAKFIDSVCNEEKEIFVDPFIHQLLKFNEEKTKEIDEENIPTIILPLIRNVKNHTNVVNPITSVKYENKEKNLLSEDSTKGKEDHKNILPIKSESDEEKKLYHCGFCGSGLARERDLKRHIIKICKKSSSEMVSKLRSSHARNNRRYTEAGKQCNKCNTIIYSRKEWRRHHTRHVRDKAEFIPGGKQCTECNLIIFSSVEWRKHECNRKAKVKLIAEGFSNCKKCKILISLDAIEDHKCKLHPCQDCGKAFPSEGKALMHYRTQHEGAYVRNCELCGKVFKSMPAFLNHKKIAHEINLQSCDECGKQFKTKAILDCHKITHLERIQCQKCPMKIRYKNLKNHMASHLEDSQKPVRCKQCDKGFANKERLTNHEKIVHLKLKHYCRYGCAFAYSTNPNRNAHEHKVHGGLFKSLNST